MKIKYQDLREKEREPLVESVPIDTPWLVMLDPANVCDARCSFCPTGQKEFVKMRPNGIMNFDMYVRIIEQFKQMPNRIKKIVYCKDGEPLLNKRLIEMLRMAIDADIAEKYWLRTNGLKLNPALNTQLAGVGLDLIGISIKAMSAEGYKNIADVKMDYDKFKANIADLYEKCKDTKTNLYINTVNLHSEADTAKFFDDFEPISTTIALEDVHNWSMSELHDWKQGGRVTDNKLVPREACGFPLYTFAINWNGQVSACQEDWAMRNIIGDLRTQSVQEIWRGAQRKDFVKMHLTGRKRELPACAHCSYIEFCPVNIDPHMAELLEKI